MSLIDSTYFIREINLPDNSLTSDMSYFITQYEKEVLIKLLGYESYVLLKAAIDDGSPGYGGTDKWVWLIKGHEYEVEYGGTQTIKWNGLVNTDLVSFLAYYIYYQWMKFHVSDTTSVGESITEKENALGISPSHKMVSAWNNFIDLYGQVGDPVIKPSAYNFLHKYESDYDKWIFTPMEKINILSI